jgi:protein OS-9
MCTRTSWLFHRYEDSRHLAFSLTCPKYEIVWKDDSPISEETAHLRLSSNQHISLPSPSSSSTSSNTDLSQPSETETRDDPLASPPLSYETMVRNGQQYLCSLPILPPEPPEQSRSNKTAKEEEQELNLAKKRGWDLLKAMEGSCIYFLSGYWSYSFCYNQGVRQFHPLTPGRNVPVYPPVEDKTVSAYTLGRFTDKEGKGDEESDGKLKLAGSQNLRYLTKKLGGGTKCDLTGEERSIEVQVFAGNLDQ